MNNDLKIIKKMYGEKMMHLCRELFPTLLEQEGLLSKLLLDNFAPSRFLYDDIIEKNYLVEGFKDYISSLAFSYKKVIKHTNQTPKQLLNEVGYDLYECKTEEDIQHFKKYYAKEEELCTFTGGRLDNCYVFFAVKKNVDEIKRENFKNPERQDEYGTSVISIQFTKGEINTLSIKNRYNHTVRNPDATFSNNLENIVPGLTESFEKEYNLNINQSECEEFELDNYVKANDGKFYKYNYEINNIYYCPNNIIIDRFKVKQAAKERYIILDYFVLDLQYKKIKKYDGKVRESSDFVIFGIKTISINKLENTENKLIQIKDRDDNLILIEINNQNQIIGYVNNNLLEIGDDFLRYNESLIYLKANKLIKIGNNFLLNNEELKHLDLPNLKQIGYNFLRRNYSLKELNVPNLESIDHSFFGATWREKNKIKVYAPKLSFDAKFDTGSYINYVNKKL